MKAKNIIKKFVNLVEQDGIPAEDMEFENASLATVAAKIMQRIDSKPVATKCELYTALLNRVLDAMKDMPQGERKILLAMKDFKKSSL